MYTSKVHKTQSAEITFSEEDYNNWKWDNPDAKHSHEKYVEEIALALIDEDSFWANESIDIVCILHGRD